MNGDHRIIIELAGPPKGKGRPRFVCATGIAFTPSATRSYEAALRYAAQKVMAGKSPIGGPVSMRIDASFPIPASWSKQRRAKAVSGELLPTVKPDADNLMKISDALNGVVWDDDKQIVLAVIVKQYGEQPAIRITVEELTSLPAGVGCARGSGLRSGPQRICETEMPAFVGRRHSVSPYLSGGKE